LDYETFANVEFNLGERFNDSSIQFPFKKMVIREKKSILTDGLGDESVSLNWNDCGEEIDAQEWHEYLELVNSKKNDKNEYLLLDCRNSYESDVGTFQGAIPLNTTFFRESWDALDDILKGKEKDAPIMTFCTGGIRCVKINAYLEQKLGFTNVNRLQGGIIGYTRELELGKEKEKGASSISGAGAATAATATPQGVLFDENGKPVGGSSMKVTEPSIHYKRNVAESKFKGVNYVFDERSSRKSESFLRKT
jgi:predicted sulfurtransferase